MEIVYDESSLFRYMTEAVEASPEHPILIDKFLEDAIEVDVDAVSDGERTIVGGVMEHIEEAGIHSGDSACAIPPYSLSVETVARIKDQTYALAEALSVRGLMNIQFAVKGADIYVLEVNPRASRTVPFVSKATGLNLAQAAARVMLGRSLAEQGITTEPVPTRPGHPAHPQGVQGAPSPAQVFGERHSSRQFSRPFAVPHLPSARLGPDRERVEEAGEHVAQKWILTRGEDNIRDLLPGPILPPVIDKELLVDAEKELGLSLRAYQEAREWLRDAFWARVHRQFGLGVGKSKG